VATTPCGVQGHHTTWLFYRVFCTSLFEAYFHISRHIHSHTYTHTHPHTHTLTHIELCTSAVVVVGLFSDIHTHTHTHTYTHIHTHTRTYPTCCKSLFAMWCHVVYRDTTPHCRPCGVVSLYTTCLQVSVRGLFSHSDTHTLTHTHTQTQTHTHKIEDVHVWAYFCTHTFAHILTYMCINTYTHMHM